MSYKIIPYQEKYLNSLYEICLQTGDSGNDATNKYKDPQLLGHYYAAPYARLEPELAFLVLYNEEILGYIVGTKNSSEFYKKCEEKWFPALRQKYDLKKSISSTDDNLIKLIHKGIKTPEELNIYPAHLHINLLPQCQGQGLGKKLIITFIEKLQKLKVPAVHLQVDKNNLNAIKFYEKIGFNFIKKYEFSIAYGIKIEN